MNFSDRSIQRIADATRRIETSPTDSNLPRRRGVTQQSRDKVRCVNASGLAIPAYGVVKLTSYDADTKRYDAVRPDEDSLSAWKLAINGPAEVAADADTPFVAWRAERGKTPAYYSGTEPDFDDDIGTVANQFYLEVDKTGFKAIDADSASGVALVSPFNGWSYWPENNYSHTSDWLDWPSESPYESAWEDLTNSIELPGYEIVNDSINTDTAIRIEITNDSDTILLDASDLYAAEARVIANTAGTATKIRTRALVFGEQTIQATIQLADASGTVLATIYGVSMYRLLGAIDSYRVKFIVSFQNTSGTAMRVIRRKTV